MDRVEVTGPRWEDRGGKGTVIEVEWDLQGDLEGIEDLAVERGNIGLRINPKEMRERGRKQKN